MTYVSDNDGFFPPVLTPYDGASDMKTWDTLLVNASGPGNTAEVCASAKSYKCPSDLIPRYDNFPENYKNVPARSYSMVWWVDKSNGWYVNPVRLVSIPNPSKKFLVLEWHEWINIRAVNWDSWVEYSTWLAKSTGTYINNNLGKHHNGGANYLYVDGHAEWLSYKDAEKIMQYALDGNQ